MTKETKFNKFHYLIIRYLSLSLSDLWKTIWWCFEFSSPLILILTAPVHCEHWAIVKHSPVPRPPNSFYKNFRSILSPPPHPDCIQSPRSYWYDIVILTKESRDYPQNCTQKVYLTFHLRCSGSRQHFLIALFYSQLLVGFYDSFGFA